MAVARQRDAFFDQRALVASSPLVLATRASVLAGTCPPPATWECVTDAQPRQIAVPALRTTLGPLLFGWAVADWNASFRDGQPFAAQEFDLPEFQAFVSRLDLGRRDPLQDVLQLGPAGPKGFGDTEADYHERVDPSREAGNLEISTATAAASVAVVVVGPAAERVAGEPGFHRSLTDDGWTLDTTTGSTGLPSAGVLFALQEEFG
jgi:hypothetical protein